MSGIGVITNPRSRGNRRDPAQMYRLGYLLGSRGSAQVTRNLDDLYRVAEEFKAAQVDILGINGGDGTIHVTLTAFLRVYGDAPFPKVAILRGGTLNTVARGLGIFGSPQKILYDVIERYHQGEEFQIVERNVLQIGDQFGFIFGNGIITNFLNEYYATGKPAITTASVLIARTIGSAVLGTPFAEKLSRRFYGQVTVDGNIWARQDFIALAASTVPDIGFGFRPFYRCTERPGCFAFLGIHSSPIGVTVDLWNLWRAKPMRRDRWISAVAKDVVINADEPFSYTIDGDLYDSTGTLKIQTGPLLQFVRIPTQLKDWDLAIKHPPHL